MFNFIHYKTFRLETVIQQLHNIIILPWIDALFLAEKKIELKMQTYTVLVQHSG